MEIWEVCLTGVALAMDAVAAGMTDGMAEPRMGLKKVVLIAGVFGFMQFIMPLFGYSFGTFFSFLVEKIAPWLSFVLLLAIGGKSVLEFSGQQEKRTLKLSCPRPVSAGEIVLQGIATSLDALAVGVTFLAVETENGLPMSVIWCSVLIGAVTFVLSACAVFAGNRIGGRFADRARLVGGLVLIAIGAKILGEGIL